MVTEQANKITLRKRKQEGDMLEKDMEIEIDTDPETGYIEYEEVTAKPDMDGKIKDFDFGIEDDVHVEMKKFADEK